MSFWSDLEDEMRVLPLDPNTADRLLAGAVAPADAPPGYADVAALLEAAAAAPAAEELAGEAEVVALAAVVHARTGSDSSPRRFSMPVALTRPRLTAALVAAGLACSAGLASAGALPGAAQDIASTMLAKVGVSVPGPNENAGTHPSVRGTSEDTATTAGQGSEISELATTTELTGVDKGAEISTAASDGKSRAGQNGAAAGAPVEAPNAGGTATANAASGGRSAAGSGNAESGQETADTASGGASSAGLAHKP